MLVTDQTMANLTGVKLAEELRRLKPTLPVIIHSGNLNFIGDLPPHPEAVTLNLSKPLRMQELCKSILTILDAPQPTG